MTKEEWNNFVGCQKQSQFLQSWQWGELAEKEGGRAFRIGVEENGELIGAASFFKKTIFGFSYFFCPRGPIVSCKLENLRFDGVMDVLFKEIFKIAEREKARFFRFEPKLKCADLKFKIEKSIDLEPRKTLIINLQKSEEDLLAGMHQKTRYNIRLAEKKGVAVRIGGDEDFDSFWHILEETVARDGFRLHDRKHYEILLKQNDFIKLFLAEYHGRVIAAVLAGLFGDMITYIHGASSNENRNVMAPFLLHWQIMKMGKTEGYKYYDLNGIDEKKWPGVTRFKIGFGGKIENYPGTKDLVFNNVYYGLYKVLRALRRKL